MGLGVGFGVGFGVVGGGLILTWTEAAEGEGGDGLTGQPVIPA